MTYQLAYSVQRAGRSGPGEVVCHPELRALGRSGWGLVELEDLVPLPACARLVSLPGRPPLGVDGHGEAVELEGEGVSALAALLPLGWTRSLLPGTWPRRDVTDSDRLPLYGYTAVAHRDGSLFAAGWKSDSHPAWRRSGRSLRHLEEAAAQLEQALPGNRLVAQLERCSLEYRCTTAQNTLLGLGEGALPTSPACNAACLGCISEQLAPGAGGADLAPQQRLAFSPHLGEVVDLACHHLERAQGPDPMVSFGQGCEGEPLLRSSLLEQAIRGIRQRSPMGSVHLNTNGSRPGALRRLALAGLGGVRVSVISTRPERFEAYYQPQGYGLAEVEECLAVAAESGMRCAINWLTLPGLSDRPEEVEGICAWISRHQVEQLQLRTLNVDHDWLLARMPGLGRDGVEAMGMCEAVAEIARVCPNLELGNFSRDGAVKDPGRAAPALL